MYLIVFTGKKILPNETSNVFGNVCPRVCDFNIFLYIRIIYMYKVIDI